MRIQNPTEHIRWNLDVPYRKLTDYLQKTGVAHTTYRKLHNLFLQDHNNDGYK